MIEIRHGDNLPLLRDTADASYQLIYIDPPFNTGHRQQRTGQTVERDPDAARAGFGGKRYRVTRGPTLGYDDRFDDYAAFLEPRLAELRRVLTPTGSLFVHLDCREVHYVKVMLDQLFGRDCFQNEIIWAYDYGARSTTRWPAKHDNILWYTRDPVRYTFNLDAADRIAYMAPELVGATKAARGKTPTDTWWHTIVSPTGHEKTGYPTQKPVGLLERIVKVHSNPGDRLADFFAGSGSFGDAADRHGRDVLLADVNPAAIAVMRRRFSGRDVRISRSSARSAG